MPVPQAHGDAVVLLLTDSRRPGRVAVEGGMLAALEHLGVPYRVHDLAAGDPPMPPTAAGVVLAQQGAGAALSPLAVGALLDALRAGTGLVSFDPEVAAYPAALRRALALDGGTEARPLRDVRVARADHPVTARRAVGEGLEDLSAYERQRLAAARSWGATAGAEAAALLADADGRPALLAGRCGAGRWLQWALDASVWTPQVLGHAAGLDEFWLRGLLWAVRKPFATRALPPFLCGRVDDCSGVGSFWWNVQHFLARGEALPRRVLELLCTPRAGEGSAAHAFAWVRAMRRAGFVPNVGLFLDQVRAEDGPRLAALQAEGACEPAAHAFSEHFDADGTHVIDFIYSRRWTSAQGRGWRVGADRGPLLVECDDAEMAQHFARVDARWVELGVRPAASVNAHYYLVGLAALAALKARGQTTNISWVLCGHAHDDPAAAAWRMAPYGNPGYVLDSMPLPADAEERYGVRTGDFFVASAHPYSWVGEGRVGPLEDLFPDWIRPIREGRVDDLLQTAADRLWRHVRRGLESGFPGSFITHEQRFALLRPEELQAVFDEGARRLAPYGGRPTGYDAAAAYARERLGLCWTRAERTDGGLRLGLAGRCACPTEVQVYADEGLRPHSVEVPPVEGTAEVTWRGA